MATALDAFMGSALAADYTRDAADKRSYTQARTQDLEDQRARLTNLEDMYEMTGLATDLGVTADASGENIDAQKLSSLWKQQVASGNIDPKLSRLAALLGNEDFAAKNNPGFEFKGASIGPEGTLTLSGGYEGDEKKSRFLTVDRKSGDDAEVAFGDPDQIAGLMANQYNQSWNRSGVSPYKRELQLKNDLIDGDQSIKGNNQKINQIVGNLTQEVEDAIGAIGGPDAAAQITELKVNLAGKPYEQQLAILQQVGSNLQIPGVEAAAAEAEAAVEPEQTNPEQPVATEEKVDPQARIDEITGLLDANDGLNRKQRRDLRAEKAKLLRDQEGPKPESNVSLTGSDGIRAKVLQEARDNETNPELKEMAETAENVTDEEIVEGKVQFTQEQLTALQERLKGQGITKLEDMNKATLADQLKMKAALSTIMVNADQRKTYLERMNNVMATGNADYNSQELETARQTAFSNQTARQNSNRLRDEFDLKVSDGVSESVSKSLKSLQTALFDDKTGQPKDIDMDTVDAAMFGPGKGIAAIWSDFKRSNAMVARNGSNKVARQKAAAQRQALLEQLSTYVQVYNKSDDAEVSWFATDDDSPISASDSSLSKLKIAERDAKGNPTKFHVLKSDGKTQNGDAITASQLATKFGNDELYDFFVTELEKFQAARK
ncbi:MAG: hypothetical protein ACPHZ7_03255 [Vibrio toranzoniae]